jgi:hypothetical protein
MRTRTAIGAMQLCHSRVWLGFASVAYKRGFVLIVAKPETWRVAKVQISQKRVVVAARRVCSFHLSRALIRIKSLFGAQRVLKTKIRWLV